MTSAGPQHPHQAELINEDGSWRYTNELIHQSSPYLLQHAHNPVNWYPWGDKAFELARRTGKPIFMSVGYSTCYWCHVMERQVFENPAIAAVMNELFVNIKVDREERPDVDDIYMTATQLLTRSGGWPMSVFLTPPGVGGKEEMGLKPFYAGTYFPPEPKYGKPGFVQLIQTLAHAWKYKRTEVIAQAEQVAEAVRLHMTQRDEPGPLNGQMVQDVAAAIMNRYDPIYGGFAGAPKFPQPANLLLLFKVQQTYPDTQLAKALAHTLDHMARGGMYDQIGGGFHRYSTDAKWLVPHFEKMLYDNGQLVETYCTAQRNNPRQDDPQFYARIVRQVCDYVLREMTDPTGALWSAQDAEVDAREGGNYVWTPGQLDQALGDDELTTLAMQLYGLDLGSNFKDPHVPDAEDVNVLFMPTSLHELAAKLGLDTSQLLARKATIDRLLLQRRSRRNQPATDDKVLVSWNGIMIRGLAMSGRTLDEPRYTTAAAVAGDTILTHMRTNEGGLLRTMRQGQVRISAFLEDYAFLAGGLTELYRADHNERWLTAAKELVDSAITRFAAEGGGYYDTLAEQSDLFVRTRTTYDGAVPSGNSQMVHTLIDLYELTGEQSYLQRATTDLKSFAAAMKQNGSGMAHMYHALLRALVLAPDRFDADASALALAQLHGIEINVQPQVADLSDGRASVRVVLKMERDYHINAHDPDDKFLIPTSMQLVGGEGWRLEAVYPDAVSRRFGFADGPIPIYAGTVVIETTITKTNDVAPTKLPALSLTYQICTESECLAPRTVRLPVTFTR